MLRSMVSRARPRSNATSALLTRFYSTFDDSANAEAHPDLHSATSSSADQRPNTRMYSEKSLNSVTLLGRVGIDPQLRGTDAHPVVSFSLATTIAYRPGGPNSDNDVVSKTEWHNVAVFKPKLRESVHENVSKGNRLMVQGRIMYGSIEDKTGTIRHTTTIVADDVIRFADPR